MWDYATESTFYSYNPFPTYSDSYVSYDSGLWTTYDNYLNYQSYYDYGLSTDTSGTVYDTYGNTSADYAAYYGSYDYSSYTGYDTSSYDYSGYSSYDTTSNNTYDITSIL